MDPLIVFDCQKVLPDRFALTLAASARIRALHQGAEPRLDADEASTGDLALREIAAGRFTQGELTPFLPPAGKALSLPHPAQGAQLCGGGSDHAASAPGSPLRETVH